MRELPVQTPHDDFSYKTSVNYFSRKLKESDSEQSVTRQNSTKSVSWNETQKENKQKNIPSFMRIYNQVSTMRDIAFMLILYLLYTYLNLTANNVFKKYFK